MTLTADRTVSLSERLAEARKAETEPRERVAHLEAALKAAVGAHDFGEAERLQAELVPAREELAIASATARVLAESVAAIEAERQAERDAIARARQVDDARREHNRCRQEFTAAQEESARLQAGLDPALGKVRQVIAAVLAADAKAQAAADSASDARAAMGESSARGSMHSPMKYLLEVDQMLGMIWSRKDPIGGRWPR